ncbi:MAG TPA: purine-nucleoside phosphorylase [Edaphobacter sp.]|nr:purine-nucleoside phosphorylase [Edaphobacter sp.]
MTDLFFKAQSAADFIRTKAPLTPRLGIILGSGLGNFASQVDDATTIFYNDIPNFPQPTVEGHAGKLLLGHIAGISVAVMQGRIHAYEGHPLSAVTLPIRVLGLLGAKSLIVTNAAGAINTSYTQGGLVAICDHINLTGSNAAVGPNDPRFGPRFFDMCGAYSPRLRALAHAEAAKQNIPLAEGVYLAVLGPSYETPAEIRAFRTLGADLVGMSTVHEVIVARHMGLEVLGLSVITNMAAGVLDQPIHHEEVMETGRRVEQSFTSLLTALIPQIAVT